MEDRIKKYMDLPFKERMVEIAKIRVAEKVIFQKVMQLTKDKQIEERKKNIRMYWEELDTPILKWEDIPDLPKPLEKYQIEKLIECGVIAKKDLIVGENYFGKCRNADTAVWLGDEFEYQRNKFGDVFPETINHFEDDNGFDLFVPIKKLK